MGKGRRLCNHLFFCETVRTDFAGRLDSNCACIISKVHAFRWQRRQMHESRRNTQMTKGSSWPQYISSLSALRASRAWTVNAARKNASTIKYFCYCTFQWLRFVKHCELLVKITSFHSTNRRQLLFLFKMWNCISIVIFRCSFILLPQLLSRAIILIVAILTHRRRMAGNADR